MTVVGSFGRRTRLPGGDEAIRRAVRLCEFWGALTPRGATLRGHNAQYRIEVEDHACPDWLPREYADASVFWLRDLLDGQEPDARVPLMIAR